MSLPCHIFLTTVSLTSFFLSVNSKLKPFKITVLNGGKQGGCEKYKIGAKAGSSPLNLRPSSFTISFTTCSSALALVPIYEMD
jgi:hypothetical protein